MPGKLGYDEAVRGLKLALVTACGVLLFAAAIALSATAQINAAPPSVTSLGFGGHATSGISPSVTSVGPRGFTHNPAFPNSRPLFGVNRGRPFNGHHHPRNGVVPWGWGVGYYAVPYGYYDQGDEAAAEQPEEEYSGGPTVFDRRGSGRVLRPAENDHASRGAEDDYSERAPVESASAAPVEPAAEQPQTVLVFKDGHQQDVANYAIVGDTLYDLSGGRSRKIPLSTLDLDATTKQNDDRGIDFQVPPGS